jgi:hypothetical protein
VTMEIAPKINKNEEAASSSPTSSKKPVMDTFSNT